jgi:NADPH-dependent 2,4-dienoyl-CoA reductase/sulfur reductase-like enzyme/rhodanese-related sulfurtransferase
MGILHKNNYEKHIVIIGGMATGPKAAARARRRNPKIKITLIEKNGILSYAKCGLPFYIAGEVSEVDELRKTNFGNIRDKEFFSDARDIEVLTETKAVSIDRGKKEVIISGNSGNERRLGYDSLVLCTGSSPIRPKIEGINLDGVYPVTTLDDAYKVREGLQTGQVERVVIAGGGLIGLEMADAIKPIWGVETIVIEKMPQVLPNIIDPELALMIKKNLQGEDVEVLTNETILKLEGDGNGRVRKVLTQNKTIETDLVILALGAKPEVSLAKKAGIEIGPTGGIRVDENLRTNDNNIYAGGDCIESIHQITGKPFYLPMGSLANRHGRVIGDNITGGNSKIPKALGTIVAKLFDFQVGRVGLGEEQALAYGFDIETAVLPFFDRPHYYPEHNEVILKLVVDKKDARLLGAQALGKGDVIKRIDVASTAIRLNATVNDIADLELGYAPPFSEAMDGILHAANLVKNKLEGLAKTINPIEVKNLKFASKNVFLLDVREIIEFQKEEFEGYEILNIPSTNVRKNKDKIPKDRPIVVVCEKGNRAYDVQRFLSHKYDVSFLEGGTVTWRASKEN